MNLDWYDAALVSIDEVLAETGGHQTLDRLDIFEETVEKIRGNIHELRSQVYEEMRQKDEAAAPVPTSVFLHRENMGTFERALLLGKRIVFRFSPVKKVAKDDRDFGPFAERHKNVICHPDEADLWVLGLYTPDYFNHRSKEHDRTYLGNYAPGGYGDTKEAAYEMLLRGTSQFKDGIVDALDRIKNKSYWNDGEREAVIAVCNEFQRQIPSVDEIEIKEPEGD